MWVKRHVVEYKCVTLYMSCILNETNVMSSRHLLCNTQHLLFTERSIWIIILVFPELTTLSLKVNSSAVNWELRMTVKTNGNTQLSDSYKLRQSHTAAIWKNTLQFFISPQERRLSTIFAVLYFLRMVLTVLSVWRCA